MSVDVLSVELLVRTIEAAIAIECHPARTGLRDVGRTRVHALLVIAVVGGHPVIEAAGHARNNIRILLCQIDILTGVVLDVKEASVGAVECLSAGIVVLACCVGIVGRLPTSERRNNVGDQLVAAIDVGEVTDGEFSAR